MHESFFRRFDFRYDGGPPVKVAGNIALETTTGFPMGIPENSTPRDYLRGLGYEEVELEPWTYYPRIARPMESFTPLAYPGVDEDANSIASARGQFLVLAELLQAICRTIHPDGINLEAYGHEIRNLLILAATEVEVAWKGVLAANRRDARKTKEYIALLGVMRLDGYGISLPLYPWLSEQFPFRGWTETQPTQSLPWYDAYNAVKHDRENEFAKASLKNAISAVAGSFVMLAAQFGSSAINGINMFSISTFPTFANGECYYWGAEQKSWKRKTYSFS